MSFTKNKVVLVGLLIVLVYALNFAWTSYQEKKEDEMAVKEYEQEIKSELDDISKVINTVLNVNTSTWEKQKLNNISLELNAPPEYRVSEIPEYQTNHSGYLTTIDKESEKTVFLPENQKPESELLNPGLYGIIINRYQTEMSLEEWYKNIFLVEFSPEEMRKEFVDFDNKSFLFIVDIGGPQILISAAFKNDTEIFHFWTHILFSHIDQLKQEIESFKGIISSLNVL